MPGYLWISALWLAALFSGTIFAEEIARDGDAASETSSNPYPIASAVSYPSPQAYLDAVRAQRQALIEQRRRGMEEAADARRKMMDPWGEAQREVVQHELELRRRSLEERAEYRREQADRMRQERLQNFYHYIPDYYGWDNPWIHPDGHTPDDAAPHQSGE